MKQRRPTPSALRPSQSEKQAPEKQALSRKEAAAILGISEGMMIKLVRLRKVAAIRFGRCVRISRSEVERALREGTS